ncbi:MAG: hypothetical protein DMF84_05330 [Acidobacteria bacterium]|nr:MAG: hypothetical protein DMF84_05330 [Acidobacteriota bacterium]
MLIDSSRSVMNSPSARIQARSITFRSSRTLPSHAASPSSRSAPGDSPSSGFCSRSDVARTNAAVRYGMSSRRSRSVGSLTSTMFSR